MTPTAVKTATAATPATTTAVERIVLVLHQDDAMREEFSSLMGRVKSASQGRLRAVAQILVACPDDEVPTLKELQAQNAAAYPGSELPDSSNVRKLIRLRTDHPDVLQKFTDGNCSVRDAWRALGHAYPTKATSAKAEIAKAASLAEAFIRAAGSIAESWDKLSQDERKSVISAVNALIRTIRPPAAVS